MDVFIIVGSDPQGPGGKSKPIECYIEEAQAEAVMMRLLANAYIQHLGDLEPGGTISAMATRKSEDGGQTNASFVVNNPDGDRHVWEFYVEKRSAVEPVLVEP